MESPKTPILLVDDTPANLLALEAILEGPELELVSVTSGADAVAQLEKRDFAVILLDLQMPDMDGIETAKRLRMRASERGTRAPIIVVTAGDADRARILSAYAHGAVDFIQKPLEAEIIAAKVAVFVELYRARDWAKHSSRRIQLGLQEAEAASERFRLLVESVKDYAIFILDPAGHVATWNEGAERIKGYRASEIIGKHFSIFYPPEVVASGKCEYELEVASREGRFEEEGLRLRKDGSELWANVTITALHEGGKLVGFAKVTRDLTERRKHEETLRHLAAEAATLAEKAQIQEFQERFIAILGHDLRNPLSAIDMGVTLLRQRAGEASDAAGVRVLDRMKASSRRMARMIEQILDLTRTRLGGGLAIAPATMDLSAAITVTADELRTAHPGRHIEVRSPGPVVGEWDADRLEQVFSNILSNAVQYGSPEHAVRVDLGENGDSVLVSIQNHGPSIPESQRALLFSAFRRGERESRRPETEGLGLGLYISREIVKAHGGDIEVSSSPTEGTTFRVTLPRVAVVSTRISPVPATSGAE